jgi:hypothetical protein
VRLLAACNYFGLKEAADRSRAVLVADEEGLAGEGLGEVLEHLLGKTLAVPVEGVIGEDHPPDIDLVGVEGSQGEPIYQDKGILAGGYLLKTGIFKGISFCQH